MAHYDFYRILNIDRNSSEQEIINTLENRIAMGETNNPGGIEELRLAQAVLGDPQRRHIYDSTLNNPQAPDINVVAIKELSTLPIDGATRPSSVDQKPRTKLKIGSPIKAGPSKKAFKFIGVVAGIAILGGALLFFIPRFGSSPDSMADEVLKLEDSTEAYEWIRENAHPDYVQKASSEVTELIVLVNQNHLAKTSDYSLPTYKVGESYNLEDLATEGDRINPDTVAQILSTNDLSEAKLTLLDSTFKWDGGESQTKGSYGMLTGKIDGSWYYFGISGQSGS